MISHTLIKEPTNFYIKYSVVIDLNTLEVIQQKLIQYDYTEIDFDFSIRNTKYNCSNVNDVRTVFSNEGVSKINRLDMTCRNNKHPTIFIEFQNSSDYYLRIYSSDPEPRDLMKAILLIVEEKNIQGCKLLTKIIGEGENIAWILLILLFASASIISNLPDEWQQSAVKFFYIALTFLTVCIILSKQQNVKIILQKPAPFTFDWLLTFKEFIVGVLASTFANFINP